MCVMVCRNSRCEVQYDYGLRQGRSKKLANRPASFTSAQGKTIVVETKTAVKNEKILERGRVRDGNLLPPDII